MSQFSLCSEYQKLQEGSWRWKRGEAAGFQRPLTVGKSCVLLEEDGGRVMNKKGKGGRKIKRDRKGRMEEKLQNVRPN